MRVLATILLSSIPSLALAQPSDPAPVPPPEPAVTPAAAPVAPMMQGPMGAPMATMPSVMSPDGPPETGVQLQARMSTQLGLQSVITPGFSFGYRTGNIVIGAEVGYIAGKLVDSSGMFETTTSASLLHIMPMVYFDMWTSKDRKARLNLVGGIGIGRGTVTDESEDPMSGPPSELTVTYVPILAGIGGDYYMHRNFALGVEFGALLPVLMGIEDNGMDANVGGAAQSLHGMIRFTFVTGE